uniref:Uncharacterized protein n=1 Tax=Nelumbo nucifera TaxID=4432 RepID=A0A822ZEN1_NELNU|nr:TPA_asm: hypothetical protein HUJ06_001253 [Nelumbo nucifera]
MLWPISTVTSVAPLGMEQSVSTVDPSPTSLSIWLKTDAIAELKLVMP